jgi:hypothetical protein
MFLRPSRTSSKEWLVEALIVQNDSSPSIRSVIPAARTELAGSIRPPYSLLPRGIVLATVMLAKDPLARARISPSLEQ